MQSCSGNLNSLDTRRQEVWLWDVWCLNRVRFINILDMPGGYQMRLRAPQMLRKSAWSLRKQDCWLLCGKMGKWACLSSLLELIELPSDSDWLLNLPDPKSKRRLEEWEFSSVFPYFPHFAMGFTAVAPEAICCGHMCKASRYHRYPPRSLIMVQS